MSEKNLHASLATWGLEMTSDDRDKLSPHLAQISQEKRNAIAEKILYRKSLNAVDRRIIYGVLSGEWEPESLFREKRGPKNKSKEYIGLAEAVDKLKSEDKSISKHRGELGKEHKLPGLQDVSLATFDKCLKSGRDASARDKLFKKNLKARKLRRT